MTPIKRGVRDWEKEADLRVTMHILSLINRKRELSQEKIRSILDCTSDIDDGEEITEDKQISSA